MTPPTAFATVEERSGSLVAQIHGEVDLASVDELRAGLFPQVLADRPVVLDLSATGYLDSSGIRMLYDLVEQLHERGQRVAVVVADEAVVRRVVVLTKLDAVVPLYAQVDDALASLGP